MKPFTITEPMLLVLDEKHGEGYFHIPDTDALHRVALNILTAREKSGYWYYQPTKPKEPDFTKQQVEAMPKNSIRDTAEKQLRRYAREMKDYEEDFDNYTLLLRAIAKQDGAMAWEALQMRSDHEYEGVRLERYAKEYKQ